MIFERIELICGFMLFPYFCSSNFKLFMGYINSLKEKTRGIKSNILAIYFAMKDKRTPLIAKIMIVLTISYAVSPIDLIPDFIPVLGYLDDLIILPIMITISIKLIPKEVFEDCRIKAREKIRISKRFGILSALIIILLWVALIIYLVSVFAS